MGSAVIFYSEIFPARENEENGVRDTRVITFQRKKNEENGGRDTQVLATQIFCLSHCVALVSQNKYVSISCPVTPTLSLSSD